jgi:hypothetical protein
MKTKVLCRLKYLVAVCALALSTGVANADTIYVTDLTPSLIRSDVTYEWASQTYTFQAGNTVDFGSVILYPSLWTCQGDECTRAGIPYAFRAIYGPRPTTNLLLAYVSGMTSDGAIETCFPGPCINLPPSPPFDLTFTLPTNQDQITVLFLSNSEPTIIPPSVPLPTALPLFATGLAGLGLLGWRRKKKAAA